MEKYSAFRDPGTGIQPFLTPVPPASDDVTIALWPLLYLIGALRSLLLLVLGLLYLVLAIPLKAVPGPVTGALGWLISAILCRAALFVLGFLWIPVETVSRRRLRGSTKEPWTPRAGDIIVSNWASFVELLWLAFRFDPIFLVPVSSNIQVTPAAQGANSPGRGTGTGSAAISSPIASRHPTRAGRILGFRRASLWQIIRHAGQPPIVNTNEKDLLSIEQIRSTASRPVVVFPECTTSNGRGLLRFADVFGRTTLPVQRYRVFVMAVRYESPSGLQPTLTHSIPTNFNPLGRLFRITCTFMPSNVSIRLLSPTDSPSSGSFVVSDVISGVVNDPLSEACGALIATTSKLKRTGQGWEDKSAFLNFYKGKISSKL